MSPLGLEVLPPRRLSRVRRLETSAGEALHLIWTAGIMQVAQNGTAVAIASSRSLAPVVQAARNQVLSKDPIGAAMAQATNGS